MLCQVVLFSLPLLFYISLFQFLQVYSVGLFFCLLHSFKGPLSSRLFIDSVYMWCCFSTYTKILVLVHSFLVLVVDHMLLRAVILLVMFWKRMFIFLYLPCVWCRFYFLRKLYCTVGKNSVYFYLNIALYNIFKRFRSPLYFFLPPLALIVFNVLFPFAFTLSFCLITSKE